jgi:hypothetical protein
MSHYEVLACYLFWLIFLPVYFYWSMPRKETKEEREIRKQRKKEIRRATYLFLWECLKVLPLLPFKIVFSFSKFILSRFDKPRKPRKPF